MSISFHILSKTRQDGTFLTDVSSEPQTSVTKSDSGKFAQLRPIVTKEMRSFKSTARLNGLQWTLF